MNGRVRGFWAGCGYLRLNEGGLGGGFFQKIRVSPRGSDFFRTNDRLAVFAT